MHTLNLHFRKFMIHHDDIPAFHAGYLVLSLIAASFLNLGVFACLISIHYYFDIYKYRYHLGYSWKRTIEGAIREGLVDFTLLCIGLTLTVYLHKETAIAGMSSVFRAEITLIRIFGTFLPKVKILHDFLKIVAHVRHYLDHAHPHMRQGWSSIDKFCFAVVVFTTILLLASPLILSMDMWHVYGILYAELMPKIAL